MIIKCKKDWFDIVDSNYYYIPAVNLISEICDVILADAIQSSKDIQNIVNSINNRGIENLNLEMKTYVLKRKVLSIECMSSAESLFVISAAAVYSRKCIIVQGEVSELTEDTKRKFFRQFGNSIYVNVACLDILEVYNYEKLRRVYGK